MKQSKMIRAWRNQDTDVAAKDAAASVNPAGISELDDELLGSIGGASNNGCSNTIGGVGPGTFCHACHQ